MTEREYATLVQTPGAQARQQAAEILRLERDPVEWQWPQTILLHRWATAVLALPPKEDSQR